MGVWQPVILPVAGPGIFFGPNTRRAPPGPALFLDLPKVGFFAGVVYDAPSKGARLKVPLRLEAAGSAPDSLQACTGNVLLFLEITPESERLQYGDRLWVRAATPATMPPNNPNAFDYQRYLHFQNIHYQSFVKDSSFGVLVSVSPATALAGGLPVARPVVSGLQAHFPGADEYAVASALLVGYKDDLSEDLRTAYAETGSMHALAVSGTHVGLLYAGLLFLLRRIPWSARTRRWGETTLVLLAIWIFTLVTGVTALVLRASVMFSTYLVGKAIRRQASIWNVLAASAFCLLAFNPYFLFYVLSTLLCCRGRYGILLCAVKKTNTVSAQMGGRRMEYPVNWRGGSIRNLAIVAVLFSPVSRVFLACRVGGSTGRGGVFVGWRYVGHVERTGPGPCRLAGLGLVWPGVGDELPDTGYSAVAG